MQSAAQSQRQGPATAASGVAVGAAGPGRQRRPQARDHRERAAALNVLASAADSEVQEIVDLVRSVCEVAVAAVGVLDQGRFHYVVSAGTDPFACEAGDSVCQYTLETDQPVVVPDATQDDGLRTSPFVDGRIMDARFYASAPVYAPSGTMVGRLCLFDDHAKELTRVQLQALSTLAGSVSSIIDLRLRRRDAEAAANAESAASEVAHDEVVSVSSQVSHDLRSPLTALTTSLAMLDESTPDDEPPLRRGLLASARRSAARMTSLVDGLLRLHDVQRGLDLSDVDLYDAAQQVLTDLETTLRAADARVSLGPLPVVHADGALVSVCLLNLVSNAVKFSRPGTAPEIAIAARRTPGGIRISVRDNGTGVPPADRERVFALFSRLTSTAGHGIGLTTVARVAAAHGGRAGIDDTPSGVGVDIWLEIPD